MFLLIDKPKGVTSHDVVNRVRRITGEKRVGHGGTLDPNATGLLIVAVGRESTKRLGEVGLGKKKEYVAEVTLGEQRDTLDAEGKVVGRAEGFDAPSESETTKLVESFKGKQKQVPPRHSALKIKGTPAYKLARKEKDFVLKTREIEVYSIEVVKYEYPKLVLKLLVSSGTYIRSIARDLGDKIGSGGYLENLRRTKVGEADVKDAVELDDLKGENWREKEWKYKKV